MKMDFDIGNLLYIIITLVAVSVGLLGKKKKPAQQAPGEDGAETTPAFLENLQRAFNMDLQDQAVTEYGEYEEEVPGEEEIVEPAPAPVAAPSSMMQEYERLYEERMTNVNREITYAASEILTEPLEVIRIEEEVRTNYFEIIRDFDAGAAVVYSAIINRIDY